MKGQEWRQALAALKEGRFREAAWARDQLIGLCHFALDEFDAAQEVLSRQLRFPMPMPREANQPWKTVVRQSKSSSSRLANYVPVTAAYSIAWQFSQYGFGANSRGPRILDDTVDLALQEALRRDARFAPALYTLGRRWTSVQTPSSAHVQLEEVRLRERHEAGRALLERYLELESESVGALIALERYEEAIKAEPENPDPLNAFLASRQITPQQRAAVLPPLIALEPKQMRHRERLVEVLLTISQPQQAVAVAREMAAAGDELGERGSALGHALAGRILYQLGDPEACRELQAALNLPAVVELGAGPDIPELALLAHLRHDQIKEAEKIAWHPLQDANSPVVRVFRAWFAHREKRPRVRDHWLANPIEPRRNYLIEPFYFGKWIQPALTEFLDSHPDCFAARYLLAGQSISFYSQRVSEPGLTTPAAARRDLRRLAARFPFWSEPHALLGKTRDPRSEEHRVAALQRRGRERKLIASRKPSRHRSRRSQSAPIMRLARNLRLRSGARLMGDGGHFVMGVQDGFLALSRNSVRPLLHRRTRVLAEPLLVADGRLFVKHPEALASYSAETLDLLWVRAASGIITLTPAVGDGVIAVATQRGGLLAFDIETGESIWEGSGKGGRPPTGPVYAGGKIWLIEGNTIVGRDSRTGRKSGVVDTGGRLSSLTTDGKWLVTAGAQGSDIAVSAWDPVGIRRIWSVRRGGWSTLTLRFDRAIVIAQERSGGRWMSIQVDSGELIAQNTERRAVVAVRRQRGQWIAASQPGRLNLTNTRNARERGLARGHADSVLTHEGRLYTIDGTQLRVYQLRKLN